MALSAPFRTRLAPSPTGALHLGNARTFLINWALARQNGWRIVLRIDDLDGPRIKAGADQEAIEMLSWLGVDWDEGPSYQTDHRGDYERAFAHLQGSGLIYPCRCTRSQIQAASLSAPQLGDHEVRYAGTCRPSLAVADARRETATGNPAATPLATSCWKEPGDPAWRLIVPDQDLAFVDQVHGEQAHNVQQQVGDFIVRTKTGWPSYQLAVVVDDAAQAITHVVRGADLLASTCRQLFIYDALGLPRPRRYWHLPLVVGADGRRLAKRHGDTKLATYRQAGVKATRIVGWLASCSGAGRYREMTAAQFAEQFDIRRMPRQPVTFHASDLP